MIWARMLAYITGSVDQELLLRNEYLAAENRILRAQIKGRLLLSNSEKTTLAEIAHRLRRKALADVAAAARPDTLLRWYRELIAKKFDGSRFRKSLGRPRVGEEIERLVARMVRENPSWGYDRIVGAMANLGHKVSHQTVANIFKRHDISPAPKRKQILFPRSTISLLDQEESFLGLTPIGVTPGPAVIIIRHWKEHLPLGFSDKSICDARHIRIR